MDGARAEERAHVQGLVDAHRAVMLGELSNVNYFSLGDNYNCRVLCRV